MTWYQLLCLLGIPTIIIGFFRWLHIQFNQLREDNRAIKGGVQASLRAQMIADYNKYMEKGYAPHYARDNFQNVYNHYHTLGANGVMDDLLKKFMSLPTEPMEGKEDE